jgi:hypothetical protein
MWAQTWQSIEPIVKPFPEKSGVDVTDEMISQVTKLNSIILDN